jgi:hypothetical protein
VRTYYHGGARKLDGSRGGLILPPSRTGAQSLADYGGEGVTRRDRVYLHVDPEAARLYACMTPGGGDLYLVEPIGEVERDPDWLGSAGESICAPAARIVRVVERRVRSFQGLSQRQVAAYLLTPDGDKPLAVERFLASRRMVA